MSSLRTSLKLRCAIAFELLQFFWHNRWWWLTPMILVLLLFGGLAIFAEFSSVTPFIYTLF